MLTNEEIEKLYDSTWDNLSDDEHIYIEFARAIESLVRERTIDECAEVCDDRYQLELKKAKSHPVEFQYICELAAEQNRLMAIDLRTLKEKKHAK